MRKKPSKLQAKKQLPARQLGKANRFRRILQKHCGRKQIPFPGYKFIGIEYKKFAAMACEAGFSKDDFQDLWLLASAELFSDGFAREALGPRCLQTLSKNPNAAYEIIFAMVKFHRKIENSPIMNALLTDDFLDGPGYEKPAAQLAYEIERESKRQIKGKEYDRLLSNIKKARQNLRQKVKGK